MISVCDTKGFVEASHLHCLYPSFNVCCVGPRLVSTKTECTLPQWLDSKTVTYAKISPKMVSPRDIAGKQKEEEEEVHVSHAYKNRDMTRERISLTLETMAMFLSCQMTFNLVTAAVILESTSDFDPSSDTKASRYRRSPVSCCLW